MDRAIHPESVSGKRIYFGVRRHTFGSPVGPASFEQKIKGSIRKCGWCVAGRGAASLFTLKTIADENSQLQNALVFELWVRCDSRRLPVNGTRIRRQTV